MTSEAQKHMMAQRAEIARLNHELSEATATASAATAAAQSNLQTILAEERERAAKDRQNLVAQITTLIGNSGEEQDGRLALRIGGVQADISASQARLDEASKAHVDNMEAWSARDEKFYSRLCDAKETVRCVLAHDWQV